MRFLALIGAKAAVGPTTETARFAKRGLIAWHGRA
jgi:hypothetical protein